MAEYNSRQHSALEVEWSNQQKELEKQLVTTDQLELKRNGEGQYIGGCDISFFKDNDVDAVASLVVVEIPSMAVVYEVYRMVQLTQPYIPGFLAFREVDHLVALVEELRITKPELFPEVIMLDGNGILHPRKFGIACHLGILANVPTLGVAKNLLVVDGLDAKQVKEQAIQDQEDDQYTLDYTPLRGVSGRIWGAALLLPGQAKSIYVSVGHRVSLETAIRLVRSCQQVRIPEPIRQADLRSRQYVREELQRQATVQQQQQQHHQQQKR